MKTFAEDLWTLAVGAVFMLGAVALGLTLGGADLAKFAPSDVTFFSVVFAGPFALAAVVALHKALPRAGVGGAARAPARARGRRRDPLAAAVRARGLHRPVSMSKLHDALHAARDAIRQIDLDGVVTEDNVNRAQHAIAAAARENKSEAWAAFLGSAREDLERTLDEKLGPAEALKLADEAETKVATVTGDLHRDEPCDRAEDAGS